MTEQKKISVILAVYNVEPYLNQCFDSLLNQTYRNLEIICVDDGSTDGSGAICDDYAARDGRVIVIHQQNKGVSCARNTALDRITGDYVYFVDGDDWLELDMLETLVGMMDEDNGVEITQCGYSMDYEDHAEAVCNTLPVPEKSVDMKTFLYYIYHRDVYRGVASYLPTKLFQAAWFNGKTEKIRFLTDISIGEDIVVAAQCYTQSPNTRYNCRSLYHYRQQPGSAMHSMQRRLDTLGPCVAYEKIFEIYHVAHIDARTMDYVVRFYVYHAGVLLDYAIKTHNGTKAKILREKIIPYLDVYRRTNADHPERYEWLVSIMNEGD